MWKVEFKNKYISYVVYSQIWLNVPRDDHHCFVHVPMDDCHLCYIKEFLKKTVGKHRAKTKLQEKLAQRACTCNNMITIVLHTVSRAVRISLVQVHLFLKQNHKWFKILPNLYTR